MKKTLASLLLITLIIAAFSFTFAVTIQPVQAQTPVQAEVISRSWYVAPNNTDGAAYAGDLVCVGEIKNTGSSTIGSISVVGMAVDENGQTLAQQAISVYGDNLAPNQKAPFYIDFLPQNSITHDQSWVPAVSNITVYLSVPTEPEDTPYTGLSISGISGTSPVTGTLQNTGNQAVGTVWAVATFYNSAGNVIAVGYTNYLNSDTHRFEPGQSASFSISPLDSSAITDSIASSSVIYQYMSLETSQTPTPVPSTPTPTQPPHTANPTTTPHTSNQPSTEPFAFTSTTLLIVIVVALVALVVVMALVMVIFLRRRKTPAPAAAPVQAPPETPQP